MLAAKIVDDTVGVEVGMEGVLDCSAGVLDCSAGVLVPMWHN